MIVFLGIFPQFRNLCLWLTWSFFTLNALPVESRIAAHWVALISPWSLIQSWVWVTTIYVQRFTFSLCLVGFVHLFLPKHSSRKINESMDFTGLLDLLGNIKFEMVKDDYKWHSCPYIYFLKCCILIRETAYTFMKMN